MKPWTEQEKACWRQLRDLHCRQLASTTALWVTTAAMRMLADGNSAAAVASMVKLRQALMDAEIASIMATPPPWVASCTPRITW